MSNNSTVSLLKMLSEADLTALGKYLQSPFFTQKKFLYPLFLALRKSDNQDAETPETIFARAFREKSSDPDKPSDRDKPFDRRKWNRALSDLNGHIENFIALRHYQNTPALLHRVRIDAFFDRENESLFQYAIDAALKPSQGKRSPEKTEDWEFRYWSKKRSVSYQFNPSIQSLDTTLNGLETELDTYYLISKIQIVCNRISAAQFLKQSNTLVSPQSLLEQAKPLIIKGKSHILILYCALLELFLDPVFGFPQFFPLLQKHGAFLDRKELETIVRFAFNYCISRQRQGQAQALDWHLKLYTWFNPQRVWSKASTEEFFLNLGVLLAKTKHLEQLDNLIKTEINALPSNRKTDALNLLNAYRDFYLEDYDAVQKALVSVKTRHSRYALMRHSLAVRNAVLLLEQKDFDIKQVNWATQKFEDFLDRQRDFSQSFCQSYRELIWFVQRLALHDTPSTALKQALKEKQPAAPDWVATMIGRRPN